MTQLKDFLTDFRCLPPMSARLPFLCIEKAGFDVYSWGHGPGSELSPSHAEVLNGGIESVHIGDDQHGIASDSRDPTIHPEQKQTMSENNGTGFWDDPIEPPRLAHRDLS
jgi:hypothetical protein